MVILGILVMGVMLTSNIAVAERIRCQVGACRGMHQADVMTCSHCVDKVFSEVNNDEIAGRGGKGCINCGANNDLTFGEEGDGRLDGGTGADRIVGGDGLDILFGGSGSHSINAAFGEGLDPLADTVDCDSSFDTMIADRLDKVSLNCEQVTRV